MARIPIISEYYGLEGGAFRKRTPSSSSSACSTRWAPFRSIVAVQPPSAATREPPPISPPRAAEAGAQVNKSQIEDLWRAHNRWRAEVGPKTPPCPPIGAASPQKGANQLAPGQLKNDHLQAGTCDGEC